MADNLKNKQVQKALKFDWRPWLKRDFFAFIISTFKDGNSKQAFKKVGLTGWEYISFMFDDGQWYWSDDVCRLAEPRAIAWLKKHRISELTDRLENFYVKNRKGVIKLAANPKINTQAKLKELQDILAENSTYVWIAHLLEDYISAALQTKVKKYINRDVEKFIGDASYPDKKNKLEQMEAEMRQGVDFKTLVDKYGWMRARDGFARGYNIKEITEHAKLIKTTKPHRYPAILAPLKKLVVEARDLVYLRTQRTDILFEFLFLARPIFKQIAKKYHIKLNDLKYYTLDSLVAGKPKKYPKKFGSVSYKRELFFFDKPIFSTADNNWDKTEVKGAIAQSGIIRGIAKIVTKVSELNKVKKGDILVTYMTSPNFLPAMKLSAGFVTNEGGLTCHAAIIAREIKKPCVIGTRIATEVFKDGDLIEVDANKGVVRLIKR